MSPRTDRVSSGIARARWRREPRRMGIDPLLPRQAPYQLDSAPENCAPENDESAARRVVRCVGIRGDRHEKGDATDKRSNYRTTDVGSLPGRLRGAGGQRERCTLGAEELATVIAPPLSIGRDDLSAVDADTTFHLRHLRTPFVASRSYPPVSTLNHANRRVPVRRPSVVPKSKVTLGHRPSHQPASPNRQG